MKDYKKVEMVAKNAPSGSYAAGCPEHHAVGGDGSANGTCRACEITA